MATKRRSKKSSRRAISPVARAIRRIDDLENEVGFLRRECGRLRDEQKTLLSRFVVNAVTCDQCGGRNLQCWACGGKGVLLTHAGMRLLWFIEKFSQTPGIMDRINFFREDWTKALLELPKAQPARILINVNSK